MDTLELISRLARLPGARIEVWTEDGPVLGIVGSKSRHMVSAADLASAASVEDLWIDIGARSGAEVAALGVRVGQPATTWSPPARLGSRLTSKAIDNRAGCAVLIAVARAVADAARDHALVFAWTVQEEVGARGARVLGQWLSATAAIVVDTTPAGDRADVDAAIALLTRFCAIDAAAVRGLGDRPAHPLVVA